MRNLRLGSAAIPLLLLLLLALMTVRIPPWLLDVSFTFNITLALVVLLVAVYVMRPLEFAAFPTILLVATLLRLALNVASTRVVLLDGHQGGAAAGQVIGQGLVSGYHIAKQRFSAFIRCLNRVKHRDRGNFFLKRLIGVPMRSPFFVLGGILINVGNLSDLWIVIRPFSQQNRVADSSREGNKRIF